MLMINYIKNTIGAQFLGLEVMITLNFSSEFNEDKECTPVLDEDKPDFSNYYEDYAEVTTQGKYRCRDCGQLFDTLEEHDKHHRKVHGRPVAYQSPSIHM